MIKDYLDNKSLQQCLKEGDIAAFEYIYKEYYSSLLNYADRLLCNIESARNVVQDVYYKMWENRSSLDIEISVKAYLFASVYHASLNILKHLKYVQNYEQEQLTDFYFSTVVQSPEAEMELWRSDIKEALDQALKLLPERCREVFELSKLSGLKNREIADKLAISEKTVERHMSLALSFLRKELAWLLKDSVIFFFFY